MQSSTPIPLARSTIAHCFRSASQHLPLALLSDLGCLVQVVSQGGVYANGQVVVQPLPAAIYGETAERTMPLRRLEAVLTEEELQEHSNKEMQKVWQMYITIRWIRWMAVMQ